MRVYTDESILMKPIGIVHSPHTQAVGTPISRRSNGQRSDLDFEFVKAYCGEGTDRAEAAAQLAFELYCDGDWQ